MRRAPPTPSTKKPEIERNVKKEEEKDHTEKVFDDYESDYDGDVIEGASTAKRFFI